MQLCPQPGLHQLSAQNPRQELPSALSVPPVCAKQLALAWGVAAPCALATDHGPGGFCPTDTWVLQM